MDFTFYVHISKSVSETKYLHYYPVRKEVVDEGDSQLEITNQRSHNPELVWKNKTITICGAEVLPVEGLKSALYASVSKLPQQEDLYACFTQGLRNGA